MRKLLSALLFAIIFAGCSLYSKVDYDFTFQMLEPIESTDLAYSDSAISVVFDITTMYINVVIRNKTTEPVKIIWNNAAWIMDGRSQKVAHSGMFIKNIYKEETPPTTITGNTSIREDVAPADGLKYDRIYDTYKWKHYYIDNKSVARQMRFDVRSYIGDVIRLLLPIEINGKEKNYTFVFKLKT